MNNRYLDHIALNVANISDSVDWYVNNFGAEVRYIDETWAMLSVAETKLALTLPGHHPPHIALCVNSLEDLGPDYREHRDGSYYVYIDDPSGNTIELIYWSNNDTKKA